MKILKLLVIILFLVGCQTSDNGISGTYNLTKGFDDSKTCVTFTAVGDNIMHDPLIQNAKRDNGYDFSVYQSRNNTRWRSIWL